MFLKKTAKKILILVSETFSLFFSNIQFYSVLRKSYFYQFYQKINRQEDNSFDQISNLLHFLPSAHTLNRSTSTSTVKLKKSKKKTF